MSKIISHNAHQPPLDEAVSSIRSRLQKFDNAPELNDLLDQLCDFEFGRYLIANRGGWNGYWTHQAITRCESCEPYSSDLEEFLFTRAPTIQATRERFHIFQSLLQNEIIDDAILASVPCGLMTDLLNLDFCDSQRVSLFGIDLDSEALEMAGALAHEKQLQEHCTFYLADAWQLSEESAFDVVASNGLNIYEPDDASVTDLYRSYYRALRPGGCLITSFLTPPPGYTDHCEWDFSVIDRDDMRLQKKLLIDILDAPWACYRSEATTHAQLTEAGFRMVDVYWGSSRIFPTVTALKLI